MVRTELTSFTFRRLTTCIFTAASLFLAACGSDHEQKYTSRQPDGTTPLLKYKSKNVNAARFLTQATFGPTDATIRDVETLGYENWINEQIALPSPSHLGYLSNRHASLQLKNPNQVAETTHFFESFWLYAARSPAQLRERMKFALSEIFVISLAGQNINVWGAAAYYDMLGDNAFGNYRTLIEHVSLHPQMGIYLTHMANQKEDASTGRMPDENYARELMQLMSIGVVQLNIDGSVKRDSNGAPIPAYSSSDISSLAKVFTGFSWYSANPSDATFHGQHRDPNASGRPMIPYSKFHSTAAKPFLGTTIPAGSSDAKAELRVALDALFQHPNVGPFIAHKLIQRLVTSNPSPAYIERVARVFNDNGKGVRGDLAAVVKAILLDPEALSASTKPGAGKVREPIIRLTNWMRAFDATSVSGYYLVGSTTSNLYLSQSPLTSPSVFNYYRPGYVPPNTRSAGENLRVPEFQIVNEVTVASYANLIQNAIGHGIGSGSDVRSTYTAEVAIAHDANALANRMNAILMYGQMPSGLRQNIIESVNSVPIPSNLSAVNEIKTARLNRVKIAVYLTMISPDYLIQR